MGMNTRTRHTEHSKILFFRLRCYRLSNAVTLHQFFPLFFSFDQSKENWFHLLRMINITLFSTLNRISHALSLFPLVNRAMDFVYQVHGSTFIQVTEWVTHPNRGFLWFSGAASRRLRWDSYSQHWQDDGYTTLLPAGCEEKGFFRQGPFWKRNHCCYSWDTSVCNSHD